MGHNHNRIFILQFGNQILDPLGGDRVECRGGLVHQHDVRLDRERPGDAQPLLLAAGEREGARLEARVHLVPERRLAQGLLDPVVQVVLHAVQAQPEGDVVEDRLGKRVRPLEHHPDAAPHLDGIHAGRVQIVAVIADRPRNGRPRDQVVHPVQAAKERRLATARRADEGGHDALVDVQVHVADRHGAGVRHGHVLEAQHHRLPLLGIGAVLGGELGHLGLRSGQGDVDGLVAAVAALVLF